MFNVGSHSIFATPAEIKASQQATKIQRRWREISARKESQKREEAAVKIQKIWRGASTRVYPQYTASMLQAVIRGNKTRQRVEKERNNIITLQKIWKGVLAKRELQKLQEEVKQLPQSERVQSSLEQIDIDLNGLPKNISSDEFAQALAKRSPKQQIKLMLNQGIPVTGMKFHPIGVDYIFDDNHPLINDAFEKSMKQLYLPNHFPDFKGVPTPITPQSSIQQRKTYWTIEQKLNERNAKFDKNLHKLKNQKMLPSNFEQSLPTESLVGDTYTGRNWISPDWKF